MFKLQHIFRRTIKIIDDNRNENNFEKNVISKLNETNPQLAAQSTLQYIEKFI